MNGPHSSCMEQQTEQDEASVRCYSDAQAAKLLSCSRRHIVNLRARGQLKFTQIGRRIVIRHQDLADFLDRRTKGGWAA